MSVKERLKKFAKDQEGSIKAFENKIGVSNGYVNSISKGIGNDKLNHIVEIYPNLNTDWLLTGSGDSNKLENKSNTLEEPEAEYIENKNGNKFRELPNGKYIIEVPKVPFKAYASFITVYADEYQTHEEFETTYFTVDKIGRGKYIAFTTGNDSMNGGGIYDTPNGAEVLARELQRHHWSDGFRKADYGFIIVAFDGIFHKDLEGPDENGFVKCISRNKSPEYQPFKIDLNKEVHSIYRVIKRTF